MSSNDYDPFGSETVLSPSGQPGPSFTPPSYQPSAPAGPQQGSSQVYSTQPTSYTGHQYAEPSGIARDPYAAPYTPPSQPYAATPQPYAATPQPYGQPQAVQPHAPYAGAPRVAETEKLSLASFICGLVGLVLSLTILGLAGIVGLVLGVAALGKFKQEPGRYNNRWMAIVGIATGAVATLVMLLWIIFIFWAGTQNS